VAELCTVLTDDNVACWLVVVLIESQKLFSCVRISVLSQNGETAPGNSNTCFSELCHHFSAAACLARNVSMPIFNLLSFFLLLCLSVDNVANDHSSQ